MKKMILGLVIGGLLGTAATVSATSGVVAVVYPVKLLLNGKAQQVPAETPILNVNGHAYLPARFLAEASGNKIDYNHEEKSINLSEASSLLIPDSYSVEEAKRNGDVVSRGTGTYNLKRLNAFLDSRNNGQRDWVRVTQFTIEGDPVLHSFYYDGTTLRYEKDSRDGYGVKGMGAAIASRPLWSGARIRASLRSS
ncbi:DUF4362 domain-containing protein [Paenibacillus sp. CC-CFT747]|nr:DUF4362 domain-containing protein [Paenibacillus sp. CC-CFT747]